MRGALAVFAAAALVARPDGPAAPRLDQVYITTFGSGVWRGPAAGDPQATEDVVGLR